MDTEAAVQIFVWWSHSQTGIFNQVFQKKIQRETLDHPCKPEEVQEEEETIQEARQISGVESSHQKYGSRSEIY